MFSEYILIGTWYKYFFYKRRDFTERNFPLNRTDFLGTFMMNMMNIMSFIAKKQTS